MEKVKKIFSIILSIVILLGAAPVTVNAAEYSGKCGDNVTWLLDATTGMLTISGYGNMYNYGGTNTTNPSPFSKYYQSFIKTICIEEGVTSVGKNTFCYLDELRSVTIKNNAVIIGEVAFRDCDKLATVTIGCNTQNSGGGVIGDGAFVGCVALSFVTIYDGLETIGMRAFNACGNLKSLTIPKSVKDIGYMFAPYSLIINYCGTSTEWMEFRKNNGGDLQYYLVNCLDKTIYPSGFCGKNLVWELTPSDGCLTFSGFGKMTDYGEWDSYFGDCGPLNYYWSQRVNKVVIDSGVETIGSYVFSEYVNVSGIAIPDSVTLIGQGVFQYCDNLSDVYYLGSQEQWDSISIGKSNNELLNAKIHYDCKKVVTPPTCTEAGYVTYTCSCCDDGCLFGCIDPTGHIYTETQILPTCTTHGYTRCTCEKCGFVSTDYTSNPTGHTLNDDDVCEVCGEKEVSTSPVNTQMLSIESVFAMIMSLLAKLFGVFTVA